jgi:hypothetical protein
MRAPKCCGNLTLRAECYDVRKLSSSAGAVFSRCRDPEKVDEDWSGYSFGDIAELPLGVERLLVLTQQTMFRNENCQSLAPVTPGFAPLTAAARLLGTPSPGDTRSLLSRTEEDHLEKVCKFRGTGSVGIQPVFPTTRSANGRDGFSARYRYRCERRFRALGAN